MGNLVELGMLPDMAKDCEHPGGPKNLEALDWIFSFEPDEKRLPLSEQSCSHDVLVKTPLDSGSWEVGRILGRSESIMVM